MVPHFSCPVQKSCRGAYISFGMEHMSPFVTDILTSKHKIMLRQREILSLLSQGQSQTSVCSIVHCSKRSVSEVSKAARDTGKSYGELLALSDSELLTTLSPQEQMQVEDPRKAELERLMPEVMKRLKGKHATMQFVHETFYKKQCPDGYSYTQFKLHVSKYRESHDYSYHNDYEPGEQMQIDFADDTEDHQRTERISPELVNGYRPEYAPFY